MNFLHLNYFLMVAEELNITRAAERLHVSQPAMSAALPMAKPSRAPAMDRDLE